MRVSAPNYGDYDYALVALSAIVAILTNYESADIVWRASADGNLEARVRWLWDGGVIWAMGGWATPTIGILARKASVSLSYRLDSTLLSIVFVVVRIIAAFLVFDRSAGGWFSLVIAGLLMGLGLTAMYRAKERGRNNFQPISGSAG